MTCPKCDLLINIEPEHDNCKKVFNSAVNNMQAYRMRECRNCGEVFYTVELILNTKELKK